MFIKHPLRTQYKKIGNSYTFYKNLKNHSFIDDVIIGSPRNFQSSVTIATALSDLQKMVIITFKKATYAKSIAKIFI